MVKSWKSILTQAIFFILIITGLVLLERHNQLQLAHQSTTLNGPDYIVTGVKAIKMTPLGQPQAILYSPQVIHYPDDTSHFTKPDVLFYQTDGTPWHVQADFGKAINGDKQVIVWGNVHIQELPNNANDGMTLLTSSMTFYPDTSLAETDQPVKIIQGSSVVTAVGFKADLKQGKIQLLSHVKTQYSGNSKFTQVPK